jgi:mannosyltransferase
LDPQPAGDSRQSRSGTPSGLRRRRALPIVAVLLATVLGGALRLYGLGTPSLWLDEILSYDMAARAARAPWTAWIVGSEFENGPLFFASLLAGRAAGGRDASVRLGAAVVGTATIPLVALAGALAGGVEVGVAAAWLLAVAPFHVYYSREGRPYALLTFLCALLLVAFLVRRRRAALAIAWPVAVALPYLAVSAIQVLVGGLLTAAACAVVERRRGAREPDTARRRGPWLPLLAASASGLVLLALLFGRFPRGPQFGPFPRGHLRLVLFVLNALAASPFWPVPISLLTPLLVGAALLGLVVLARRDRLRAVAVGGLALAVAVTVWFGMEIPDHFFTLRYFSPVLPPFLVLAAAGIAAAARGIARLAARLQGGAVSSRLAPAATAAMVLALVAADLGTALGVPYRKADWRDAARAVAVRASGPATVLAANGWSRVCLDFYLRRAPRLRLQPLTPPPGEAVARALRQGPCWLVRGGYPEQPALRRWLHHFPAVWHGRDEGIGVFRCTPDALAAAGPGPPGFVTDDAWGAVWWMHRAGALTLRGRSAPGPPRRRAAGAGRS